MTYNRGNKVILNYAQQDILKNTIAKSGFGLKIPKLRLYIIKYKADSMQNLYRGFKKVETYFDILNTKAQMQKKFKLKSGYKIIKSFQATIASEQNP